MSVNVLFQYYVLYLVFINSDVCYSYYYNKTPDTRTRQIILSNCHKIYVPSSKVSKYIHHLYNSHVLI